MSDLTDFFPAAGGGGGGGASLTGTTTYRALLIGGGANGILGNATYGAGGPGAGAFFETILPFFSDITYNVVIAAAEGTTTFETAIGKFYAPPGGAGRTNATGLNGASGGGGNAHSSTMQYGGNPFIYTAKGNQLVAANTATPSGQGFATADWVRGPGVQTLGFPGGYANSAYRSGGGGGAGGPGQANGGYSAATGGAGRTTNIINTTTATSASVGDVNSGEVWFGGGGYGGRLSYIVDNAGSGPGTGGGGQSSKSAGGVSNGDSGCAILKVPTSTNFTQTGASTYTDQGMTAIIWTGAGTFQINS